MDGALLRLARIARRPKLTAPANAIDASCSQQGVGSRPELGVCSRLRQLVRCAERVAESWRAHRDGAAQSSANVNPRGLRSSPFISIGRAGRVVAGPLIFAPRPAPPRWLCRGHSVVRPSPRSSNYGENGDGSTEPQAASWRPCASIDVTSGRRARLRRLQQHVLQVAEQWHGAGSAAFVRGPLGLHFY